MVIRRIELCSFLPILSSSEWLPFKDSVTEMRRASGGSKLPSILFSLAVEPFLHALLSNNSFQDDVAVSLSEVDFERFLHHSSVYAKAFNAKLNKDNATAVSSLINLIPLGKSSLQATACRDGTIELRTNL